jgi:H/ACA ribonucleoprotein complex subunit 4
MPLEKLMHSSVILIDKPRGPTSFDVVEHVSKILKVKKAGHTGTLDPNATGLLVIALGEARKAMPVLTGLDKEYVGTIKLHGDMERKKVEAALKSFEGEITQVPPVRSAVARKPRKRLVHDIEVLGMDRRDVKFRVLCEAGTYVRLIAHDAGEKLGCGAHLIELRRTRAGPFSVDDSVTLPELEHMSGKKLEKVLIPLEKALEPLKMPKVVIKAEKEALVRNGYPVRRDFVKSSEGIAQEGSHVLIFGGDGRLVCLAEYAPKGDIIAKTDRVFLR